MSAAPIVTSEGLTTAPAQAERVPVFVDATGHRRRWLRLVGYIAALGCLIFGIVLVSSLLWSPITPDTAQATSNASPTTTSQTVSSHHGANGGAGDI
ncbi:MAG TPA: hypothetical protein VFU43_28585 [Streptosporangiaceae bacterium]|nr:hypothetical protein [Streptosporangiaceae bacterium]